VVARKIFCLCRKKYKLRVTQSGLSSQLLVHHSAEVTQLSEGPPNLGKVSY